MINTDEIKTVVDRLGEWAERRHFAGYDPYDALNSPLTGILSLGTRWGRIALTQFGRRSPINYRPLLGIRPGVNPKALGLFMEGFVKLYRKNASDKIASTLKTLFEKLLTLRSPGMAGSAWGYHFPWQNRFQLLPRWTPTIVNSSFIGHALLDYHEATGNEEPLKTALSIPDFFLNNLNRKREGDSFCFSYTPKDENFVHNANMLGASLLARLANDYGESRLLDPALGALRYSMNHQREDGSWFYAENEKQQWIDSFHTGFNLEVLRRFIKMELTPEYRENYRVGVDYYADQFFLEDGTPKYYNDRLYLVDLHAPAEAIFFFSGEGEKYRELTEKIIDWTMRNMYSPKSGLFYFRKSRRWTIKTPYIRWVEAWAFRGLTEYYSRWS